MPDLETTIRKFEERDRDAVRHICYETGFLGNPIDEIFIDRELFADLIVSPYLNLEPEHALVAIVKGEVVGYLLGSTNPNFELKALPQRAKTAARMLRRYLGGKYDHHPRSKQYVRWIFTRGFFERPKHPHDSAHFHINMMPKYRGAKIQNYGVIAGALLREFEGMLEKEGIKQYYGEFYYSPTHRDHRNLKLYKRLGFYVYGQVPTTMFQPTIEEPFFTTCVVKELVTS